MNLFIFNFIHGLAGKLWLLDYFGIFLADYFGYFLILIAGILILKEKGWQGKIYFFSLIALSIILSRGIIAEIIRFFYPIARPFSALNFEPLVNNSGAYNSFPSGHATFYFALAFAIFLFFYKRGEPAGIKLGWQFLTGALIIGIARIFSGVHWPLDILAGAFIGIASVFLVELIIPKQNLATAVTKEA